MSDVDPAVTRWVTSQAIERGRRMRRRRRVVATSVAAGAIVALAISGVATLGRGGTKVDVAGHVVSSGHNRTGQLSSPSTPATTGAPTTSTAMPGGPPTTSATPPPVTAPTTPTTRNQTTTSRIPSPSTTSTAVPDCGSQLVGTLSVPQGHYSVGDAITVTYTVRNTGGYCIDRENATSVCWSGVVTVTNRAGPVWNSDAQSVIGPPVGCQSPLSLIPVPAGHSQSATFTWHQQQCLSDFSGVQGQPNPYCPGTQVPVGTYSISDGTVLSPAPVTVTIS